MTFMWIDTELVLFPVMKDSRVAEEERDGSTKNPKVSYIRDEQNTAC